MSREFRISLTSSCQLTPCQALRKMPLLASKVEDDDCLRCDYDGAMGMRMMMMMMIKMVIVAELMTMEVSRLMMEVEALMGVEEMMKAVTVPLVKVEEMIMKAGRSHLVSALREEDCRAG